MHLLVVQGSFHWHSSSKVEITVPKNLQAQKILRNPPLRKTQPIQNPPPQKVPRDLKQYQTIVRSQQARQVLPIRILLLSPSGTTWTTPHMQIQDTAHHIRTHLHMRMDILKMKLQEESSKERLLLRIRHASRGILRGMRTGSGRRQWLGARAGNRRDYVRSIGEFLNFVNFVMDIRRKF